MPYQCLALFSALLALAGFAAHSVPLSGQIRDLHTGLGIPGAKVRIQSTTTAVTADAFGEFVIDFPADQQEFIAAGQFGYFTEGIFYSITEPATPLLIDLQPLPTGPALENPFNDPINCSFCHGPAYNDWAGFGEGAERPSRHATAGMNLWVRDLLDGSGNGGGLDQQGYVYKRDSTALAAGSPYTTGLCAECHLPLLSSLVPDDLPPSERVEMADATEDSPPGSLERIAYETGVSCEVCHKMESVQQANGELGRIAFYGKAEIHTATTVTQFGTLEDSVIQAPPVMRAAYNPLLGESLACAPCHEYNMDHDFDGDFDDPGSPSGQTTYSEWLASPYSAMGVSCQDCHMTAAPEVEGEEYRVCIFGGPPRSASNVHNHRFDGTTLPFLQAAVDVVLEASRVGDAIAARVDVINVGAGHDFPTGFSTRNVILAVTAEIETGADLDWIAEGTDLAPDWAGVGSDPDDYGNKPGRGFAKKLIGRGEIEGTTKERVFFIDAIAVGENTRIPAGGTDRSRYQFNLAGVSGSVSNIEARLVYRRAWKDLVESKGWTTDGQGMPYSEVVIETASAEVSLVTGPTPTPTEPPQPNGCDLNGNGRCDAADLVLFLRDWQGIEDHPTDFDASGGPPEFNDLFIFSQDWYDAP